MVSSQRPSTVTLLEFGSKLRQHVLFLRGSEIRPCFFFLVAQKHIFERTKRWNLLARSATFSLKLAVWDIFRDMGHDGHVRWIHWEGTPSFPFNMFIRAGQSFSIHSCCFGSRVGGRICSGIREVAAWQQQRILSLDCFQLNNPQMEER